jgi:hypothetical protein
LNEDKDENEESAFFYDPQSMICDLQAFFSAFLGDFCALAVNHF